MLVIMTGMVGGKVYAVEQVSEKVDTTVVAVEDQGITTPIVVQEEIEYTLPYPGILPDHTLYKLKALRDAILEKLISDPLKKMEFYVLQADKRLGMGMQLVDKEKAQLAESTISKGEKYMEKAIMLLQTQKDNGGAAPGYIADKIRRSLGKHEELILELLTRVGETEKQGLEGSLEMVKTLQEKISGY